MQKVKPLRNILLAVLISLCINCCIIGSSANKSDIPGTYVTDYKYAKETLIMVENGTFVQVVTIKATMATSIRQGTWSLNNEGNMITFHGKGLMEVMNWKLEFLPNYATSVAEGIGGVGVNKVMGRVNLEFVEGYYYKQVFH
jgi:hypothetical protein